MKSQQKRSFTNSQDIEMDPYSTTILDELIENDEEWESSDQIIKLTFKAMTDVIKIHGQSIKDIKSILTTRASKTQLTTGLSLKANVSDISQTIDQISTQLQEKLSYEQLTKVLKEYVHRSEMSKAQSERQQRKYEKQISQKDIQLKQDVQQLNVELQIVRTRMNEFQKEIAMEVSNCVTINEFRQALNIIDTKANIKQIDEKLDGLVSKQFLSQCLQKKINKTDIQTLLDAKADVQDLEYIVNSLQSKVNLATLEKLTQVIQNKADKSDVMLFINEKASLNKSLNRSIIDDSSEKIQGLKAQMNLQLSELSQRIQHLSTRSPQEASFLKKLSLLSTEFHEQLNLQRLEQAKRLSQIKQESVQGINSLKSQVKLLNQELHYRNNNKVDTFTRELTNQINLRKRCEEKIYQEIDDLRKKFDEVTLKLFEKSEMLDLKEELLQRMDNKIEKEQLSKAISQLAIELTARFEKDNESNTLLLQKFQKTYSEAISTNTTDIVRLNKTISKKQDKFEFSLIEETMRKARKQVEECRKTVDKSYQELQSKLSISEYQNDLLEIKKRFDKLFKDIQNKANIKDVCVLADSKPNIEDVNNALKQINEALNEKIAEKQLQAILKDQSAINETLCSENIVGRWMWQSGELKSGGLVPWEIESANTVPEHFFWEKDKTSILILAPGIYEIKACIFSKNSMISVLINGQNLEMDKNDQNSNILSNMRGKSVSQTKKKGKSKDFCGNKLEYFVMLPARSRVSLCCIGDGAQGFLNIRRF